MQYPKQAFILAAGFGTRMLPLSLDTPKPMMPLWGKPILGHVLELLERWGVRDALVNLHHQPDSMVRYLRTRRHRRLRIQLSFESEILGTGGALRRAEWFFRGEPFWLMNADVVADLDPAPLFHAFRRDVLAVLWMHPEQGPRTVEMAGRRIVNFQSSRPGTSGTFTFCGLHLVSPRVLDYLPESGFGGIIEAYQRAQANGRAVVGVCVPDVFWADMGTPDSYLKVHEEVLRRFREGNRGACLMNPDQLKRQRSLRRSGVRIRGFASLGEGVVVEKGAVLWDSVLWDHARIAGDARVERAVVGTATIVRGTVRRLAVRSDLSVTGNNRADVQLIIALQHLKWRPEETTILPFEPRGSARAFTRLERRGRSVILIRYSLEREENALYAQHARFLKAIGMPVPEVILDMPARQMVIVEDLGDTSLQLVVRQSDRSDVRALFRRLLDIVYEWHIRGYRQACRKRLRMIAPFSADLYQWERHFFARHFLRNTLHLTEPAVERVINELERVADRLVGEPRVLVHRDLQSSNILMVKNKLYLIDFQGMRFGPAVYDLASLLCDPYVELPAELQDELLDEYQEHDGSARRLKQQFWWGAIERLAQALGAYGRLSANADTAGFGRFIQPALRMMHRALIRVNALPHLTAVVETALH